MKKRLVPIASLAFMLCLLVFGTGLFWSMPCEANWFRIYGDTAADYANGIQQTTDGGYIVAGSTNSFGAGSQDAWVSKLDGEGNVIWQKTYGGAAWDSASSIQQTTDRGYIVAGNTGSFSPAFQDAWVLKLDESGNVIWQKTYGGTAGDYAEFVQQTTDRGYIVTGSTRSFGTGNWDAWVLKLDENGNVIWQKTYGGTGDDDPSAIQQTTDGGYILAGNTRSFGAGNGDAWVVKLEADGDVIWQKTYGGTAWDGAIFAKETTGGGYIVVGGTESFGAGSQDAWVLKLDESGNVIWQKTYGGPAADIGFSVRPTTDGGYVVAGSTSSFGTGAGDAWVLKLDENGNVTWQKTFGGPAYDYVYLIQQTTDGGYITAGTSSSFSAGSYDAWLMKLDQDGSAGSCPFEGTSTAVTGTTAVAAVDTTATAADTSVTGLDTTIVPSDSNASSSEFCPLSDNQLTLKVGATRKRRGEGTLMSTDGLIDCPDACQAGYNQGVVVTLSTVPSSLSTFMGWKPASLGCEGTDPCRVTMDKKKTVKAVFLGPNKLKVVTTFKDQATGTVASGDALVSCPGDCDESYVLNAPVTLTATAGVGSSFVKWTGSPCKDEPTNVCIFTMDKNATVKAIFQETP